jgi:hypothetical protein
VAHRAWQQQQQQQQQLVCLEALLGQQRNIIWLQQHAGLHLHACLCMSLWIALLLRACRG